MVNNLRCFDRANAGVLWTTQLPGATATHAYDPILRLRSLDLNLAGSAADNSAWFTYNPASPTSAPVGCLRKDGRARSRRRPRHGGRKG